MAESDHGVEPIRDGGFQRGQELESQGRTDDALAVYELATELEPQNATAWHRRG